MLDLTECESLMASLAPQMRHFLHQISATDQSNQTRPKRQPPTPTAREDPNADIGCVGIIDNQRSGS